MRIDKNSKLTYKGGYIAAAQSVESPSSEQTGHTLESLSDRIIQSWFSGVPSTDLRRLADAAPALLEAAKQSLSKLEEHRPEPTLMGTKGQIFIGYTLDEINGLRAAIKQATQTLQD